MIEVQYSRSIWPNEVRGLISAYFLIALGWLDISGFGIQQMSIVGLVIALGLLVDNAIVVTENIGRLRREGLGITKAAMMGTRQVAWAVVSGTLTTILAFLPILLLQTGAGTFTRSMSVTVVLALTASLFVALTLTPLLTSRLPGKITADSAPKAQLRLNQIATGPYKRLLEKAITHPWKVLILALLILLASLSLLGQVGVSMFPKSDKPIVLVNIELPEATSFNKTLQVAIATEQLVAQYPEVKSIATNIGKGNPRIHYNETPKRQVPNLAQLMVQLKSADETTNTEFVTTLRNRLQDVTAARITVKELLQGPPYDAPITIRLLGDDLALLSKTAANIKTVIEQTPGTVSVDNPIGKHKVDLKIIIDREKAALTGINIAAIDQVIRTSLVGSEVGLFQDTTGEDFPLVIKLNNGSRPTIELFSQMQVKANNNSLIPVEQLTQQQLEYTIPRFQHRNLQRVALITSDVVPGYNTEAVTNQIAEQLNSYNWPPGIEFQVGGEQEKRKTEFSGMAQMVMISLLGIFAVMVVQFRSFLQPLIIFTAIPFAITGAIVTLWLTNHSFSFVALIGLASLVGIVVNNSIILVDYANQQLSQGASIKEAIISSGTTRLTPIILTTLTTIGGLLPLTLSSSTLWAPMGWSIIGGLAVSTLLTLVVVPVLYQLISKADTTPVASQ